MNATVLGEELSSLWQTFTATRTRDLRDRLIEEYLPFARSVAARAYAMRLDNSCSFDDYLQYARMGLIESVDRFDPARETTFEAFSSYRIRGAILNGLGKESELAAQRSYWRTRLRERSASIQQDLVDHPERASLEDFVKLTVELALGLVLESEDDEQPDESIAANPYAATELRELRTVVRALVERLPDRERTILRGHYYEQREFQSLAQDLQVSKGRVSQLHSQALSRIRALLEERPAVDRRL